MSLVTVFEVERVHGVDGYVWRLVYGDREYAAISDGSLGAVMGAFRRLLVLMAKDQDGSIHGEPPEMTGPIRLTGLTIERLVTQAGYRIWMQSGEYEYTALTDWTLESVIAAMSGAMRFFAVKYGICALYGDAIRNTQAAHEQGFEA